MHRKKYDVMHAWLLHEAPTFRAWEWRIKCSNHSVIQVDYSIIIIVISIASFSNEKSCIMKDWTCWTTVLDQYYSPCAFVLLELLLLNFMDKDPFFWPQHKSNNKKNWRILSPIACETFSSQSPFRGLSQGCTACMPCHLSSFLQCFCGFSSHPVLVVF